MLFYQLKIMSERERERVHKIKHTIAPQLEGFLTYLMKLLHNLLLIIFTRNLEPFVKRFSRTKYLWQKKVEKGPEFMQIVLHNEKTTLHLD